MADPSSKWLEILHTALSRRSRDLGSWSSALHLFQHRCQVKLLCCRLHKGEKRATNEKEGLKMGDLLCIQPREKRIPWASGAAEGRLHICLEMTTPWSHHLKQGLDAESSPPEGNKKGVCIPDRNFTGNGGIALPLAGERGNFHSKAGSSPVRSSTVQSHCTRCMAFYE